MAAEPGKSNLRPTSLGIARAIAIILVVSAAWAGSFLIRFDGAIPTERLSQLATSLPLVVLVQVVTLQVSGSSRHSWRYTNLQDLIPVVSSVFVTGAVLGAIRAVGPRIAGRLPYLDWIVMPYGVIGAYVVLATLGLVGARALRRVVAESSELRQRVPSGSAGSKRILFIGAGRAGVLVARELLSRPDLGLVPVGFVDDDPAKLGRRISQLSVVGTSHELQHLVDAWAIDEVVITVASATGPTMRRLVQRCEHAGLRPMVIPGISEIVTGQVSLNWFRPVELEDLLGRAPVELDTSSLHQLLTNECVIVTGAGGSIGSELARQVAKFSPRRLVLLERSEPALWAIHRELRTAHPDMEVVQALADVTDHDRVSSLLREHRPSLILHAAAHKHVPMMELNPGEGIKNNVLGTRTIINLAHEHDVKRFVLISTDKAVNPTSIMGATKRLAERYVQHVAAQTGRPYVAVRFGNVLGSTGSVVPIFREQIAAGGPVTITHPEMRRYFMTIPEASQLVLQAATLGRSGEILVLDMGEPMKITELAESLIRLTGFEPHSDIEITFTGLRPGEKLFEELSLTEEGATATRHPKIAIGRTSMPDWASAEADLTELARFADRLEPAALRKLLAQLVPEFSLDAASALGTEEATPRGSEGPPER